MLKLKRTNRMSLNADQSHSLSDFFFDIAKAAIVGSFGFSTLISDLPIFLRLIQITGGAILGYFCIKIGLVLLEK